MRKLPLSFYVLGCSTNYEDVTSEEKAQTRMLELYEDRVFNGTWAFEIERGAFSEVRDQIRKHPVFRCLDGRGGAKNGGIKVAGIAIADLFCAVLIALVFASLY